MSEPTLFAARAAVEKSFEKRRVRDLKTRPQVRKVFPPEDYLRSLARSCIKRLIHPLIILPGDFILDGECRWRGLMLEAPDHEVDVIVVDRELSPAEIVETQMISAMHSSSLRPYDQALACKEWMEKSGGAAKELAEKIDRDPSMVTRLLSLFKCESPVIQAAEAGKIGPGDWYAIYKMPPEQQAAALASKLAGATRDAIERERKKRNGSANVQQVKLTRFKLPLTSGAVVQVSGAELDLGGLIDVLKDLLKQATKASDEGHDSKAFVALLNARSKEKAKKP